MARKVLALCSLAGSATAFSPGVLPARIHVSVSTADFQMMISRRDLSIAALSLAPLALPTAAVAKGAKPDPLNELKAEKIRLAVESEAVQDAIGGIDAALKAKPAKGEAKPDAKKLQAERAVLEAEAQGLKRRIAAVDEKISPSKLAKEPTLPKNPTIKQLKAEKIRLTTESEAVQDAIGGIDATLKAKPAKGEAKPDAKKLQAERAVLEKEAQGLEKRIAAVDAQISPPKLAKEPVLPRKPNVNELKAEKIRLTTEFLEVDEEIGRLETALDPKTKVAKGEKKPDLKKVAAEKAVLNDECRNLIAKMEFLDEQLLRAERAAPDKKSKK